MQSAPLLELQGVTKSFGAVKALDAVDFRARSGEIHALMGENGAGKSTLIKVLTGALALDSGTMRLGGQLIRPRAPIESQRLGISTVYQEVNLVPTLSVAENICLGREPTRLGRIRWNEVRARARTALARLGLELDVDRPAGSCSLAIQQLTAIARALEISCSLLILDEPTSSLDAGEVEQLFGVMRKLRQEGMAIVFVTHFMDQVYAVSDRITVLRNGKHVGEHEAAKLPRMELIAQMMGKELAALDSRPPGSQGGDVAAKKTFARARRLCRKGSIQPFDLELRESETLGLAGLLGSGRSEIARLLFGVDRPDSGTLAIDGREVSFKQPRQAMRAGFAMVPEDRKALSIFPDLSVRENLILALQAKRGWMRLLPRRRQDELVERYRDALRIKAADAETPIRDLSGGNQQKVILARWLACQPRLLILDEPTRGIDVGAKAEIQKLVMELGQGGMSVIFISSELEEVLRCSHRVAVLRDRAKVSELEGAAIHEHAVLERMAGGEAARP
jgi:monosaccharide-transporting ATPase